MTCEFFTRYSHIPAERQMCGAAASRTLVLTVPQRHNHGGEQRIHLCQEHYAREPKALVYE